MTNARRFLGIFDPGANNTQSAPAQPAAQPSTAPAPVASGAAPSVVPQPQAPVTVVVNAASNGKTEAEIRAELEQSRRQLRESQQQQAATPAATPAPQQTTPAVPPVPQIDPAIQQQLDALKAQLHRSNMESYAQRRINETLASGQQLIESMVFGNSEQEIEASIKVAIAEYELMKQRILGSLPQQPQPQQQVPVAYATNVAAPMPQQQSQQQPVPQQQVQQPSVPSYLAAPGVVGGGDSLTMDQLRALTSPESIRNGTYAQNRHRIQQSLRGALGVNPVQGAWSLTNSPQMAPPMPVPQQNPAAVPTGAFHGVSIPQVQHTMPRAVPQHQQFGQPQQMPQQQQPQFAPQPSHVVPGQPVNRDAVALAAQQAIAANRARAGGVPN